MHIMSKKDLSSDELDTLRRSRNSTDEEAQVYVHDLNLCNYSKKRLLFYRFSKLCEDHGYVYEIYL